MVETRLLRSASAIGMDSGASASGGTCDVRWRILQGEYCHGVKHQDVLPTASRGATRGGTPRGNFRERWRGNQQQRTIRMSGE